MECGTRALPNDDLEPYLKVVVELNEHISIIKIK